MSIELDQENAKAALELCRKEFQDRPLATGHSIVVDSAPQLPRFGLGLSGKATALVSLAIKDHRCEGAVTLFAVRPRHGQFELHYEHDGRHAVQTVNSLDDLRDGLDVFLERVDSQHVAEAIADYRKESGERESDAYH
jgi:hypothetical protein